MMRGHSITDKIKTWAIERGLSDTDPLKQFNKLLEEQGELADAVNDKDKDLIQDAIGDMYVVCTILLMQVGERMDDVDLDLAVRATDFDPEHDDQFIMIRLSDAVSSLGKSLIYSGAQIYKAEDVIQVLSRIAHLQDLDLFECIGMAYDEIKHRKGDTVDGVFQKDTDQNNDDYL